MPYSPNSGKETRRIVRSSTPYKKRPSVVVTQLRVINLATSYSRATYRSTTIGAAAFHFRVRNGNGWCHCAKVTRNLAELKSDLGWGVSLGGPYRSQIRQISDDILTLTSLTFRFRKNFFTGSLISTYRELQRLTSLKFVGLNNL